MSALKELRDTISNAKLKGHKVISLAYVDAKLAIVAYQSKNATTDTLDALNGEVMTNESRGNGTRNGKDNCK